MLRYISVLCLNILFYFLLSTNALAEKDLEPIRLISDSAKQS